MKTMSRFAACAASFSLVVPAHAAPNWAIHPVQTAQESIRYKQGVPTVAIPLRDGVVQITPLPLDHGSLSFAVAVYNNSHRPANFGIENVAPAYAAQPVRVFSKDDLARKAKNRAFWTQFGMALAGGVAAGLAASATNTYSSSFITPRGTYRSYFTAPSFYGQYQAARISSQTSFGMYLVQAQLDATLANLGDRVIQLTTVDPGESYGGTIVIDKIRPKTLPAQVQLAINWNGETYLFTFQIARGGSPAPHFTALALKSDFIDFRQGAGAPAPVPTSLRMPAAARRPDVAAPASPSRAAPLVLERDQQITARVRCITCR